MIIKRVSAVFILATFFLVWPLRLEQETLAARYDKRVAREDGSPPGKKAFEYLKQHHPEVLEMIREMKVIEKEARGLAREYAIQTSEDQKREIEHRLRWMLEDILRKQFELTDRTLQNLVMRYEQLRNRHERNKERFDEIVERRLQELLHLQTQ